MQHKIVQMQSDLLEKSKAFLRGRDARPAHYNVTDPENYLSVWAAGSLGALRAQCLRAARPMSVSLLAAYIRNVIALGHQADHSLGVVADHGKYKRVVVSWCVASDLLPEGAVRSGYFNCTTDDLEDVLWVMLPLDGLLPQTKKDNIVFFSRNRTQSFSISCFLKNLFFCLTKGTSLSPEGLFARKLADEFLAKIDAGAIAQILMPYEGQPWQHTLSWLLKKRHKDIQVLGDLHSCLPPFPVDFIKRCGAPDIVFMHGRGQKDIMMHALGWHDDDVKVVPSLRFGKSESADLRRKILLPYSFRDAGLLLDNLAFFYENFGSKLPALEIRNHPVQSSSPLHQALIKSIEQIQAGYRAAPDDEEMADDVVVVIGASSAIIECLQRGMKVFQIAEDLVFDAYGPDIWAGIEVQYINENIVSYSLSPQQTYLEFGTSDIQMMFENA